MVCLEGLICARNVVKYFRFIFYLICKYSYKICIALLTSYIK
jgi:hypothetical protein